jgi:hypothetical protein
MGISVVLGLAALVATVLTLAVFAPRYLNLRGKRVVTCPETRAPAGVSVKAAAAAAGGSVRLSECTRWPERQGCGQECLQEIQEAPDGCLVRETLARWFESKSCGFCGKALKEIVWHEHRPRLMNARAEILEWDQVPVAAVAGGLDAYAGVCWRCHAAHTFRKEHPELVVDR